MKLEVESKILVGADSKAWLADLTKQIDRLERLHGGKKSAKTADEDDEEEDAKATDDDTDSDTDVEDDDFEAKSKSKKTKGKASFDEDDDTETDDEEEDEAADEDEDEEEAPVKKAGRPKKAKITIDDLNDAAKAKVRSLTEKGKSGAEARDTVTKLMKKKFGVKTVTALEPEQYADFLKAMKV